MARVASAQCVFALVGVLATTSIAYARPASVSDPQQFQAAVAAVRTDANNYDKFKEPVATGLTGQAFSVRLPMSSDLVMAETRYDYQAGKLILSFEPRKAWPLRRSPSDMLQVVRITENTRSLGSYIGRNAYGATAKVRSYKSSGAGLAIVSAPKSMLRGGVEVAGRTVGGNPGWWTELELPAAQAKALALGSSVRLEGTYANLPWGDPGFCDFGGKSATLDSPSDFYSEVCYLGANITRIAIMNEAGDVIREWTSAKDPVIGPELWRGIRVGMDKYQLKALFPGMTDYGRLEGDGFSASVQMDDGRTTKVEVTPSGALGDAIYREMMSKYGQPLRSECIARTLCKGEWRVNRDVVAYLTIGSTVTFQLESDPPPYGFTS